MKNLKRILDLIRKTGDRYIFEDENEEIFVILPVNDYENLALKNTQVSHLSEEELLNKINKDIAVWKSAQENEILAEAWQEMKEEKAAKPEDDRYYFEAVEDEE